MNKKTFKVILKPAKRKIIIKTSSFTESDSWMADFESEHDFSYVDLPEVSTENLILNPEFSDYSSSTDIFENWAMTNKFSGENWLSLIPNGYPEAARIEYDTDDISTLTSASFAVSGGSPVLFSLDLYSSDGIAAGYVMAADNAPTINYRDYYPSVIYSYIGDRIESPIPAIYKLEVDWYSGSSLIETSTLKEGFGITSYINEWYKDTNQYMFVEMPRSVWINWKVQTKSPSSTTKAVLRVSVFADDFNYAEDSMWEFRISPYFAVDNIYCFYSPAPLLKITPTAEITAYDDFYAVNPTISVTQEPLPSSALAGDCTGHAGVPEPFFKNDTDTLYLGRGSDGVSYKTWVPFIQDFEGEYSRGFHITSACLVVTSSVYSPVIANQPTILKIGMDSMVSRTAPTSWAELEAIPALSFTTASLAAPWMEGADYAIDITEPAKAFFGIDTVVWDNGERCAVVITDGGSYAGTFNRKEIASYENNSLSEAKLLIIGEYNSYEYPVLDTYVYKPINVIDPAGSVREAVSYSSRSKSPILPVGITSGSPSYGLISFNTSAIPQDIDSVTSASVCLFYKKISGGSISIHNMLSYWDALGVDWDRPYGTGTDLWVDIEDQYNPAGSSISLLESSSSGIALFNPSNDLVENWITGSLANNGFLLKAVGTSDIKFNLESCESDNQDYTPYMDIDYIRSGSPFTIRIRNNTPILLDEYTKSLLHFNGDYIDYANSNTKWVPYNLASISATTKQFGTGSLSLANAGDGGSTSIKYLKTTTSGSIFDFGSGDFTIDFWLWISGLHLAEVDGGQFKNLVNIFGTNNRWFRIALENREPGPGIRVDYGVTSPLQVRFNSIVPRTTCWMNLKKWYHIAIVKYGLQIYTYINGIRRYAKATIYDDWSLTNPKVIIGSDNRYSANAYIDEFRFSKGVARWTASSFSKPTEEY